MIGEKIVEVSGIEEAGEVTIRLLRELGITIPEIKDVISVLKETGKGFLVRQVQLDLTKDPECPDDKDEVFFLWGIAGAEVDEIVDLNFRLADSFAVAGLIPYPATDIFSVMFSFAS